MKPVLRYLAFGLPLYLLFVIALFPATQAYRFVSEPLGKAIPELNLTGIDGSVWSGRAGMVVFRKALLGEVSWELSTLSLLLGKAKLKALLQSENGYLQSNLSTPLTGGALALTGIEGQLPLAELLRFTPYLPVVLEGRLSLNLSELELTADGRMQRAEGTAMWHQAAMTAPQELPLGDLKLALHTEEDGKVIGDISDQGGPLKVEGKVEYSPDGSYRVNGTVAAAENAPESLAKALGWLGKPDPQGRYRLNYNGKL